MFSLKNFVVAIHGLKIARLHKPCFVLKTMTYVTLILVFFFSSADSLRDDERLLKGYTIITPTTVNDRGY